MTTRDTKNIMDGGEIYKTEIKEEREEW